MQKEFKFSQTRKILFYCNYFFDKLVIFKDVKEGACSIYLAEVIWVISQLLKKKNNLYKEMRFLSRHYETDQGKFYIHPDIMNVVIVSPAFEKDDVKFLISEMQKEVRNKRSILFVDIGASFGKYSITIGNHFKKNKNVKIVAFEPNIADFSQNVFSLLKKNTILNGIKNIKLFNIGLGSKESVGKSFEIKRLDNIFKSPELKKIDSIFIKLDIDGGEIDVLMGAEKILKMGIRTFLLIEDFVNPKNIKYLEKNNFKFIRKDSPYNSFWVKNENI